jgi:ketosteroid isomerase-like protein
MQRVGYHDCVPNVIERGRLMKTLRRVAAMFTFLLCSVLALSAQQMGALKSMVDAERRFAKASVDANMRDAFLAFFAPDGVEFGPGPVNVKETFSKQPVSPKPPPVTLDWEPVFANVSQAGDLGFTTGPYILTDNVKKAPAQQGYFFSIWKKQTNGEWKVVLDHGIEAPVGAPILHPSSVKSGTQSNYHPRGKIDLESERQSLLDAERQFSILSESNSTAEGYARFLDSEARMNRDGTQPYVGSAAIKSHVSLVKTQTKWVPMKADVASSGDLGYDYGSYESHEPGATTSSEHGYFARVWKRDNKGDWKIAMDTATAAPAENK